MHPHIINNRSVAILKTLMNVSQDQSATQYSEYNLSSNKWKHNMDTEGQKKELSLSFMPFPLQEPKKR